MISALHLHDALLGMLRHSKIRKSMAQCNPKQERRQPARHSTCSKYIKPYFETTGRYSVSRGEAPNTQEFGVCITEQAPLQQSLELGSHMSSLNPSSLKLGESLKLALCNWLTIRKGHCAQTVCQGSAPRCGVDEHALGAGQVGVGGQGVALLAACTSVASAPHRARLRCRHEMTGQLQWRLQLHKG